MPGAKFCGHCGAAQVEGARFCGACGKPLLQLPATTARVAPERSAAQPAAPPVAPTAAGAGSQPWRAQVGEPPVVVGEGAAPAFRLSQLPGWIASRWLSRIPAMLLTLPVAWLLHTYWLVVKNEGWQGYGHPMSVYWNVMGNGSRSFMAFGLGSALVWSILYSLIRPGPKATLDGLLAPLRNFVALVSQPQPQQRLGLALGLALVMLGNNAFGLSSSTRLYGGLFFLTWGLNYFGPAIEGLLVRGCSHLKSNFPWARGLEVATVARSVVVSLPAGFLASWFLAGRFSQNLGWLALAYAAYLLYSQRQATLLIALGLSAVAMGALPSLVWADDGGWAEAVGNGGLTPDNLKTWWNSVGAKPALTQGAIPALGAAVGAGLSPPLQPPGDGKTPEKILGYMLHLSADRFQLKSGQPSNLEVSVYTVTDRGVKGLTPGAAISLNLSCPQIAVQPLSGSTQMVATITWNGEPAESPTNVLRVSASAGGSQHSNTVALSIQEEYELVVTVRSFYS